VAWRSSACASGLAPASPLIKAAHLPLPASAQPPHEGAFVPVTGYEHSPEIRTPGSSAVTAKRFAVSAHPAVTANRLALSAPQLSLRIQASQPGWLSVLNFQRSQPGSAVSAERSFNQVRRRELPSPSTALPVFLCSELQTVLVERGLDARKVPEAGKKPTWAIEVSEEQASDAVRILAELGLPRPAEETGCDVFGGGLIRSPVEEQLFRVQVLERGMERTLPWRIRRCSSGRHRSPPNGRKRSVRMPACWATVRATETWRPPSGGGRPGVGCPGSRRPWRSGCGQGSQAGCAPRPH
jgi:hypothetical protein